MTEKRLRVTSLGSRDPTETLKLNSEKKMILTYKVTLKVMMGKWTEMGKCLS